jgi:hypothetical protein
MEHRSRPVRSGRLLARTVSSAPEARRVRFEALAECSFHLLESHGRTLVRCGDQGRHVRTRTMTGVTRPARLTRASSRGVRSVLSGGSHGKEEQRALDRLEAQDDRGLPQPSIDRCQDRGDHV